MTFRDTLAPKPSPLDVASMPNTMFPEEIREYSDQIRNAYYYSRNLGVPPQIAMDLEPAINEHLYGEGISSSQAWQQTSSRTLSSRRKSLHTAAYDGWRNSVASATAQAAGFGRFLAEFKGIDQSVVDPAFRWMLGIPKDVDLDDVLAGISVAARQDIIDGNKDNPNRTLAIDQDAGYAEALYQVITRPENLLQGLVESGPLILEGMLTGGAFGKILGAGAVRAGRILGMGVPISSQAYGDARAEGTAPLSALGQALLTGGIEAVIEEWTLGRKIGLAKHFKRYVQSGGMRRAVWEGTKAFGRGTAEEGTQTLNENFWRWVFTDRSQEWFEGVSQAMAMGGPLEAVMSGAFSGVSVIGTPVEAKEAQRRLKVLRKLVKNSTLSPAEKEALNLEFDKAAGLVPDILTPIEKGLQEKGARFVKTPSGEMGEGEIRDAKRKAEEAKTKPEIGEGEGGEGFTPSVTEGMPEILAEPTSKADKPIPPTISMEAYETPEEAKTARTQLEAEAGEKVSPRLYIGNVTPRAKKAWGKIFGKPPAAVHTFKEGAFPTKRTAIEMTRGQAESYLTWLEEDLASRIDNNEINTNRDIAMAHADWGDIASIRRVLGIEVGVEPFRVHYTKAKKMAYIDQKEVAKLRNEIHRLDKQLSTLNAKEETTELTDAEDTTRDRLAAELRALEEKVYQLQRAAGAAVSILKNVKAVISSAVTPSKLQMSNLTVQEVLRATMKRGARYAKMAYAGGRRELRAQIQAQREARRRLASAIKRARQPIPNTVKLEYRQAIHELRKGVDLRRRSQKVLAERRTMRRLVEKYPEVFKGMPTKRMAQLLIRPLNDFTIGELEDLASQIDTLIAMGQVAKEQVVVQEEKMKKRDLGALTAGSTKATARDIIRPDQVGKPLTLEQRTKNTLAKLINTAKVKWRAFTMPMDVLFDLADGGTATYDGPNYRIFKRTLDERYGHYKNRADGLVHDVRELARALGLTNPNFERIGVYAVDQQKGGRQKLLDTGYTETEIKSVELNDGEMQVYAAMREALDELRPDVEAVLRDVYDREMSVVENYFPWLTNFAEMSDSKIQDMFGDTVKEYEGPVKQKKVDLGITLTRTYGTQAVKINAMEVFERHVDNASYLIEMSGDIKRLFEIANTQQYSDAVGESVQMEVLNYLSLMARKGGIERNKSIPILDVYRKHVGAATLGFKLSSALINVTPLLDGAGLIGRYAFTGAYDIATNQELRVFLGKNFPELRDRMGGEIDLRDFGSSTLQRIEKAGFWPLQKIDGLTAMSIVAGAYQKYLDEHGLKLDLTRPNTEGIAEAQRIMRRTQASGFSKDLPSAFTQGTVTGNVSIDRLLLHFQTFIVNRWSFIEHDMLRAGIKTGNTTQMMNIFFWMSMALFAELGLRRMSKELIAMMTGEDLDDWGETFTNEWVANALQTVPGLSQATSAYTYGSMPVPTLAITNDLLVKLQYLKRTKNPNKKLIKAIELGLLSTGTAMGVPGTRQLSDIANSYNRTLPSSRGKKKFEWKSTR